MTDDVAGFAEAQAALAARDHPGARRLLAEVVLTDPRHEQAWFMLATVTDNIDQAIDCLQRVLALNPQNVRATAWLERAGREKARLAAAQIQAGPTGDEPALGDPDGDPRPVPRLGQFLLDFKFVSAEQLRDALLAQRQARQAGHDPRLGDILVAQGALSQERLNFSLREQDRTLAARLSA